MPAIDRAVYQERGKSIENGYEASIGSVMFPYTFCAIVVLEVRSTRHEGTPGNRHSDEMRLHVGSKYCSRRGVDSRHQDLVGAVKNSSSDVPTGDLTTPPHTMF